MESKAKTSTFLAMALIGVISLGILLPGLGTVSFWDSDEARYAECARNAIQKGHWVVPYYNGHPRIVKPPLMVWLVAISSLTLNKGKVTEFTARLPSVIAATGTGIITYLLARALLGSEILAFLAAFMLITSHLFYKQARFSITDMVLTFFITLALYCFYKAYTKGGKGYILGMYGSLALATMDKGPAVGLVLPGLIILVYLAFQGNLKRAKKLLYPPGLLLYFLIVLPWPMLIGKKYLVDFLWKNNIKRFAANSSWETPFWFYIVNFPSHFTPWAAFIPLVAGVLRKENDLREIAFPMAWFAVIFLLFSLSDTKRSSYILPLYPAAAIISAWAIGKGLKTKGELKTAWRLSFALFALILVAYALGLVFMFARHVPMYTPTATASLGLALVIVAFILLVAKLGNYQEGMILASASALVLALGYTAFYQPIFDKYYRSPKPYCLDIKATVDGYPLYHYGSIRAHDIFYIQKGTIPSLPPKKPTSGTFFVMTRHEKLSSLKKRHPELTVTKSYRFRDKEIVLLKGN